MPNVIKLHENCWEPGHVRFAQVVNGELWLYFGRLHDPLIVTSDATPEEIAAAINEGLGDAMDRETFDRYEGIDAVAEDAEPVLEAAE